MKRIVVMVVASVVLENAGAQFLPARQTPAQSASGQFLVRGGSSPDLSPALSGLANNTNYIVLEPTLLAVSCERVKQKLWSELGVNSSWRGRIYLNVHPARSPDDWVKLVSEKFTDGWNYRVELPSPVSRDRYIRAIVQALLLELSNRNARDHTAEVPTWLAEGLGRELRASYETELFLPPPKMNVRGLTISPMFIRNALWSNPLDRAQRQLRTHTALTFEQLSWPAAGQLEGAAGETYRCNAQLLVNRLMSLPDGPASLRTMLDTLPRYYNWQTAFLTAFRSDFPNLLDVEKWWALQVVQFTGLDLTQTWPMDESWRKLDDILHAPVDVRTEKTDLPLRTEITLQTVLRQRESAEQIQLLQRKLRDLDLLRLRVPAEVRPMIDDYRRVLQNYLQKRGGFAITQSGVVISPQTEETIRQLNVLDARRAALQAASLTTVTAATQTRSAVVP
jgi:hypothetical protein